MDGRPPVELARAVLPNCLAPVVVQGTLGMGTAILETAGLSFLGLGDDPSTPEWGRMIADQFRYIRQAWWTVLWSRPPRSRPISDSECRVSSRSKYMATCRAWVVGRSRLRPFIASAFVR